MSDNPTADATPVDADSPSQVDTHSDTPAESLNPKELLDNLRKKNSEAEGLRRQLRKYEQAEKDKQQSEMTESQRYKAQLEELTGAHSTALQELRSLKAQGIARDAGALYPDLVADKLSDEALSGDRAAREKEVERLRKQYPGLFRTGSADGGAKGETQAGDMNQMLRRAAGRTS